MVTHRIQMNRNLFNISFFRLFFFVYYYPGCTHTTAISCELAFSARETLPPTNFSFPFLQIRSTS